MQAMARRGFLAEVVSGPVLDLGQDVDLAAWLAARGWDVDGSHIPARDEPAQGPGSPIPGHFRLTAGGVMIHLFPGPTRRADGPGEAECRDFLRLLQSAMDRLRPDVLISYDGDPLSAEVRSRATDRGMAVVFPVHNFHYFNPSPFAGVDAVLVPSRFAAHYYREALGLECAVLPNLVDFDRVRADRHDPRYVTFVNPSAEKGVYAFARIADELGRHRPDIPLLVVEGRGTEATLAACGLDLRVHGNINLMAHTPDPRRFWGLTRIALLPSLWWENQPLVAVEAMINGIPVIGSDRGGVPETLGDAGRILPLPDRLTPATRNLATADEVAPWVEEIIRLWDDGPYYAEQQRRALARAQRWDPEELEPRYQRFFEGLPRRPSPDAPHPARRADAPAPTGPGRLDRNGTPIRPLAEAFPWPGARPAIMASAEQPGWLGEGTDYLLACELSTATRVVVELGAWLGLSTRFIADRAPNAVIVSVDHWQGSPEHREQPEFRSLLPTLYDSFLSLCWPYRDRVIPLRMTTLEGLQAVADHGLCPDLIYVDAEHSYHAVTAELELARWLFPAAAVVGDDYDWSGVRAAVNEFAERHSLALEFSGSRGWKLVDRPPVLARDGFIPPGRARSVVLVPHLQGIESECERRLCELERVGVRVVRLAGSSAIDLARNMLASDALHDGAESLFFIDADLSFDPLDVLRLLARPEPVIAGVYAKKGPRELACRFAEDVGEVAFGQGAFGLYPLKYAATGFLRIRAHVLRTMIERLELPLCNTPWGRGFWPFFQPLIVAPAAGVYHYLGEDWAFSHRLSQIGVTPLADTMIRLWHIGPYRYGWEEAGEERRRYERYIYQMPGPDQRPPDPGGRS
jgi:glycosyltransferase involved in cell wall biosynthesis